MTDLRLKLKTGQIHSQNPDESPKRRLPREGSKPRKPRAPIEQRRLIRLVGLVADDRRRSLEEAHEVGEIIQESDYQILSRGALTKGLPKMQEIVEGVAKVVVTKQGDRLTLPPDPFSQIAAFGAISKAKDGAAKAQQGPQAQIGTQINIQIVAPAPVAPEVVDAEFRLRE